MSWRYSPHFMKWYPQLHSCLANLSERKAPWFCMHLWIVTLWQFGCNNIVESACDGKGCKRRRRLCFVMMLRSQQLLGFSKGGSMMTIWHEGAVHREGIQKQYFQLLWLSSATQCLKDFHEKSCPKVSTFWRKKILKSPYLLNRFQQVAKQSRIMRFHYFPF